MSTSQRASFENCVLASGLLTAQQLADVRAALRVSAGDDVPPATDIELADRLVEQGLLNSWQAKQLLDGRSKFTLGPYRIVDSLGQGGMGHVYKAQDITSRDVAIKVLPRDKSTPEAVANFNREIQALASLNHPKLVRALDAGYDGSVYYLVTEFVPGSDLRKLVRRIGPLTMESAASIIAQVAEGLQHAHDRGMVHRDVKPGNVLVTPEGEAKLSDLGLAGPMHADPATMRRAAELDPRFGKIVGTADYLAPDHVHSPWNPTPSWDIYSLGCTLYYAVTGKVPFPGGTTAEKARAHCELRPLDPRRLNHQLSNQFVDVLADMMAKDPKQRISTALQVIERLMPWVREAPDTVRSTPLPLADSSGSGSITPPSPFPGAAVPSPLPTVPPPTSTTSMPNASLLPLPPPPQPSTTIPSIMPCRPTPSSSVAGGPPAVVLPYQLHQPIVPGRGMAAPPPTDPVSLAQLLRDTVPDVPRDGDSQESVSMEVADRRSMPIGLLVALVVTPIVLAAAAILVGWIWDVMF